MYKYTPLADKMRPENLDNFAGQKHLVAEGKLIRRLIENDSLPSMIFWGPPGVGKTTLAKIISKITKADFISFSAANARIKEIKELLPSITDKTILFIDEIHRLNKSQQDVLLPYVENGTVTLIGATTENPGFEVNAALLSRCKVFLFYALTDEDIKEIIDTSVIVYEKENGIKIEISDSQKQIISRFCNGDARTALNTMELILNAADNGIVDDSLISQCLGRKINLYDKAGEEHYNLISALHKSMRNSDVQAAVYWLARMLESGDDPLYVARRVTRFASEDIGLADPNALAVTVNAYHACHFIGMPECGVHLTQAVVYCALAPKSNALYNAYNKSMKTAEETSAQPVPLQIRNAPVKLMSDLGYGKDYKYAHDFETGVADMQCMPDNLIGTEFYIPSAHGKEIRLAEYMKNIENLKKK